MIVHHSLKILEQLSEIETLIGKIERYIEERGIEVDREKLLIKLLRNQEAIKASRILKKTN